MEDGDGDTGGANLDVSEAEPSSRVLSWPPVGSKQRNSMGGHRGVTVTRHLVISACGNPLGNVGPRAEDPSRECIWCFGLNSLLFSPGTLSMLADNLQKCVLCTWLCFLKLVEKLPQLKCFHCGVFCIHA